MSSTMDHPTSAATGAQSAPPNLTGQVAQEFVGQPPDADAPLDDAEREEAA